MLKNWKYTVPNLRMIDHLGHFNFQKKDEGLGSFVKECSTRLLDELIKTKTVEYGRQDSMIYMNVNERCYKALITQRKTILNKLVFMNNHEGPYVLVLIKNRLVVQKNSKGCDLEILVGSIDKGHFFKICKYLYMGTGREPVSAVDLHPVVTVKTQSTTENHDHPNTHEEVKTLPSAGLSTSTETVSYLLDSGEKHAYHGLYDLEYDDLLYSYRQLSKEEITNTCNNHFKLVNAEDTILNAKNIFTLPFCDPNQLTAVYGDNFNEINVDLFSRIGGDKTVAFCVNAVKSGMFKERFQIPKELNLMRMKGYQELNDLLVDYRKNNEVTGRIKIRDIEDVNIQKAHLALRDINKRIQAVQIDQKRNYRGRRVIQVPEENLNILETNWRSKDKKSIMRQINVEHVDDATIFIKLCLEFLQDSCYNTESLSTNGILDCGVDTFEMMQLKEVMMKDHQKSYGKYSNINLAMMSEFVSRFCYTLLYFSQTAQKGNQIQYSNLGFKNVLLMVRGGKKIFNTGLSRMFKLLYPVPSYFSKYRSLFSSSTEFHELDGNLYMINDWSVLNEKVLNDMMFFNFKTCSHFCNYYTRSLVRENINLNNILFGVLLAFNNRRSTESNLSNLRYLMVNTMAVRTKIKELIQDTNFVPIDGIQLHILNCLRKKLS